MIASTLTAVIEDKVTCINRNKGQTLHHMLIADLLLTLDHIEGCRELDTAGDALGRPRRLGEPDFIYRIVLEERIRSMGE